MTFKTTNAHGGDDGKDEYLTPRWIIEELGRFDLDPCSPVNRPWPTAIIHYTIDDDGLKMPWGKTTRVWMNPPYGHVIRQWMKRMAEHQNGIALVFARTDTEWWRESVWEKAHAILWLYGRLVFCDLDGEPHRSKKTGKPQSAGAPSVLISYSQEDTWSLLKLKLENRGWLTILEKRG